MSPRLWQDVSVGLLGAGSLRRLAQLPVCNQEELVCVSKRDALSRAETAGLIALRVPIIRLLFEHGSFDSVATNNTAFALMFYSVGLFAFVLMLLMERPAG